METSETILSTIKDDYQLKNTRAYFNTAGTGLVAPSTKKVFIDTFDLFQQGNNKAFFNWRENRMEDIRKNYAFFLGAETNELAFVPNFSTGLNFLLASLEKKCKVLLYEHDYPSLTLPFELQGFDVFKFTHDENYCLNIKEIEILIKNNGVKILAISQVQYLTGYKIDLASLAEICRDNKVILIVDGTQSIGALNFSFKNSGVDVLIGSNYKWMNAGFGTGFICIRNGFLDKHIPKVAGFGSFHLTEEGPKYSPSINSYEPGHLNFYGIEALDDAINIKLNVGLKNIENHISSLIETLVKGLEERKMNIAGTYELKNKAGIVCLYENDKLYQAFEENKISCTNRGGFIRLSVHFYNTEEDVDLLLQTIDGVKLQ